MSSSQKSDEAAQFDNQQNAFEQALARAQETEKRFIREATWRRSVFYALRLLSGGAGIGLTAGASGLAAKIIGILVMAIALIDQLFVNHLRLLIAVKSSAAARSTVGRAESRHRKEVQVHCPLSSPAKAVAATAALHNLTSWLDARTDQVEEAYNRSDYRVLAEVIEEDRKPDKLAGAPPAAATA